LESKLELESRLECQDRHVPFLRFGVYFVHLMAES
jgi:hypothetical protein